MQLATFQQQFEQALQKNQFITFGANCVVHYNGRAQSYLGPGDRTIIIKPDKTLLIHQPTGSAPVNYMKEGTMHSVVYQDDALSIESHHMSQKEYLTLEIHAIHFFHAHTMHDAEKITLAGSEKDMSDMIYNQPELIEAGFTPLSREEHTKYGFIDVFGYDTNNVLVVVECKRYTADLQAVTQLRRYVQKIKKTKGLEHVRGILVAPKISPNAQQMLQDYGYEFKMVLPPNYLEQHSKQQHTLDKF